MPSTNNIIKDIVYYIVAIFLSLAFLCWVLQLWSADLTVPFIYSGDAALGGVYIKGMIDNGSYLTNPNIGMPTGFYGFDFPVGSYFELFIMKAISFIHPNWAWVIHVFYLLTFPLTVISSLFVLRRMDISPLPAIVGSLLFAFIPYHFFRGEAHLFLSAYFLIPLVVMVIFCLFEDGFLLDKFSKGPSYSFRSLLNTRNIFSIVICIGIASSTIYYPFFSCFFLLVGGMCATISKKRWMPLFNSFILIGIIVLCIVISNIPSLLYWFENGRNPAVAMRLPQESEIYGFKIIQLLLPVLGHRIPLFAHIADIYARTTPLASTQPFAALGILGSIGFILLIIWVFHRMFSQGAMSRKTTINRLNQLSVLNLSAVLLATIGGFGTIFAYSVSPQIRCYDRISVFIAFFSITTVALVLNLLIKKYTVSRVKSWGLYGFIVIILFAGIFDQTSPIFVPHYKDTKEIYLIDERFVQNIETRFPADTMVFQLPYIPYSDSIGPVENIASYDHFKAYLHSKNIRWSYGAVHGRDGDLLQRNITNKPIDEMISGLSMAGFNGIYVDSYGYKDAGKEIISSLTSLLRVTPLVSENMRLYFFDMTQYNNNLTTQFTPQELEKKKDSVLNYLRTEWQDGFSGLEGTTENSWRWCSSNGALIIVNPSNNERKFNLKANFVTGYPGSANLKIESTVLNENLKINNAGYDYEKVIAVPPGRHVIKFNCDAKRVDAPTDPRYLVFAIKNFKIEESE